jgi:mono/diheme cytochrome c family protein
MRDARVDGASAIAGTVLFAIAIAFAAARSTTSPPHALTPGGLARGAAVFRSECASCHPSSEELAPAILRAGSAAYAIELLLRGRVRKVRDGVPTLEERHPVFDHLADEDLAAVIEAVVAAGQNRAPAASPFRVIPEDVRRARK